MGDWAAGQDKTLGVDDTMWMSRLGIDDRRDGVGDEDRSPETDKTLIETGDEALFIVGESTA